MKKIIYSIMTFLFVLSLGTNVVNASEKGKNTDKTQIVSNTFIQLCDEFFEDNTMFEVLDTNGNNISDIFYSENLNNYQNNNYLSISIYFRKNVDVLKKNTISNEDNINARNAIKTKKYSYWFYKLDKSGGSTPDFEIQYEISGSYKYNANTGKITSATTPSFNVLYCSLSGLWSYQTTNVKTNAKIASDNYSMTASCSFNLDSYLSIPVAAWSYNRKMETFGPYTGSKKYTAE